MATAALTSPQTVRMGWTFGPLPQVESPVGYLKTTPTGLDSATKVGCKSQSFTSWDCVSRLYVGGVFITEPTTTGAPSGARRDTTTLGDIPTPEEQASFTPAQKILMDKGLKIFVRGKDVLTKAQVERLPPEPAQATTSRAVATGSNIQTRSMADNNTGYYYSDILPIRCVAVSTMISARETDPIPYSPQYQILAGLNDPAQTGVLSAVVRGPNVRDATTMSSMVKALALRPSTRYEIASMVRCGCMALSVGEESFATDAIPYRFVRKPKTVSGLGIDIMQKPGVVADSWKAVAMPLDTFVALANNSYYSSTAGDFTYGGLDVTWTAVPVPSRLLRQSHLIAYLMSFLSSDAWSGTVTYQTVTNRDGPANKTYMMNESYMPVVNSTDIPGVKNVCLVLIDETSPNCPAEVRLTLRDTSVTVPVWKGPTAVTPVSIWPAWDKFWHKNNIPGIRRDTVLAFSEICTRLGVSDACGTALSVLAELYGQWYGGVAPPTMDAAPTPDYSKPAYGAWTYDGTPLDKTGQMKSHLFNLDQLDKVDARRRAIAYNFSGISPQHVFPTGLVRSRYIGAGQVLRITWSSQQPEVAVPGYNIQTMTSVNRVATAMGLIMTHTQSYRFASPTGFVHWVHMLSCAISFSTSAFLTINDITPRDWAGIYNKYDVVHRDMVLDTLKSSLYGGILIHHDIENLFSNISEWDLDIMADYWLLSPYSNVNWMTFSPVPCHCTQQWIDKMGLTGGVIPKGTTTFNYKAVPYMAMKVRREYNEHKFNMISTIDAYRRYPQALVREPGDGYVCVLHWVDNVAGYSNAACSEHRILSPGDMYESLTYCASINNIGIPYSDPTDWYIIGSNYEYGDPSLSVLRTTPIQWPDPSILDTLWQGAKNYILKPVAPALAGFLTGYVLLRDVVENKHTEISKLLLTNGSRVNSKKKKPFNIPLHFAVINGDIEIVKMLLCRGANIDAKNQYGRTPYHNAVESKNMEIIELFLNRGADVNARNSNSTTPLHIAVETGGDEKIIRTPFHNTVKSKKMEIIESLLNRGAYINARNSNSITPLHLAVEKNSNEEIIKLLLSRGANVDAKGKECITSLHIAVERGCLQIVEHLLEHGAHVNSAYTSTSRKGYTPLHLAVEKGSEEIIKLLLSRGANVEAKGKYGITSLHIAAERGYLQIVEHLLKHGARVNSAYTSTCREGCTPLYLAVEEGHKKVVKLLLEYGANVNAKEIDGITSLHIAAKGGYLQIIKHLLKHGAHVDSAHTSTCWEGYTPLHFAVEGGNEETVKLLLSRGANVDAKGKNGITSLHIAAMRGYLQIVDHLLKHGAHINSAYPFWEGCTPLYLAVVEKDMKKLLSYF